MLWVVLISSAFSDSGIRYITQGSVSPGTSYVLAQEFIRLRVRESQQNIRILILIGGFTGFGPSQV